MNDVFFITGAANGIGRATARYLLCRGYRVFLTDSNKDSLEDTCKNHLPAVSPKENTENLQWCPMDVTKDEDVVTAVRKCINIFERIDVLVNNAGINSQYFRNNVRMDQVPISDFEKVLSVNLVGTYRVSQHCIPHLEVSPGGGVIINMSSCRATQQQPHGEAYAASKAGINGMTMAMALSLGPKVRVHSLSPGMVDVRHERNKTITENGHVPEGEPSNNWATAWAPEWGWGKSNALKKAHPVGRLGTGEDIAKWVEFLGVVEGGFTTGQDFLVDGGYSKVLAYPE